MMSTFQLVIWPMSRLLDWLNPLLAFYTYDGHVFRDGTRLGLGSIYTHGLRIGPFEFARWRDDVDGASQPLVRSKNDGVIIN